MSGRASSPWPRRVERGGISWVTLLLLVLVLGGGYLGWVWVPLKFDDYTVQQVVRDYMNQAIKNPDDEGLRRNMVLKIRSLAQVGMKVFEVDLTQDLSRADWGPAR